MANPGNLQERNKKITFAVIVGNRGFFPDELCRTGRETILRVLREEGFDTVALSPEDTKFGTVETLSDAAKCAALFRDNQDRIDGILVTLPNFGDERSVADVVRASGLKVPVLVHAFPDNPAAMGIENRRDSFCGKISVCNNLRQYDIPFSLTRQHTMDPDSAAFRQELHEFASVCRVVKSLQNVRFGAIGTRPANFNTVRYSEKILAAHGISIEPIDLSEILGRTARLHDEDTAVQEKLAAIRAYTRITAIPEKSLLKMAKLGVVVDRWMEENQLAGMAFQCWTAIEEYFGVVPCTVMSMLSNSLLPSACEVDVPGLIGMYALQQAANQPTAILDWNNNFGDDPDKCVVFHCSNIAKDILMDDQMDYQAIVAGTVGKENTYGTIVGRVKPGPFTYVRVSTDDTAGVLKAYFGEGEFTSDTLSTFGGFGVARIPNLQGLVRYICENGFEHHVAVVRAQVSRVLNEALGKYLGWSVYEHH